MICYMPFTDVDQVTMDRLFRALGPFAVFSPAPALVSDHLHAGAEQGMLEVLHPDGVDEQQLRNAIQGYKTWADLHQRNLGDMAGFFKTQQGRFPLVEDTLPTQIGDQIRHYGEDRSQERVDPVFKAALFLSMAHEYDQHHHAMNRDLDAVQAMERQMLERLAGDDRDAAAGMSLDGAPVGSPEDQSFEIYMVPQRVEAWARIVLSYGRFPLLYLTTSHAVFEHVLDFFPRAMEVTVGIAVERQEAKRSSPAGLVKIIGALAGKKELTAAELEGAIHVEGCGVDLVQLRLFALQNVRPRDFLEVMTGSRTSRDRSGTDQGDGPRHTFFGLVKTL